MNKLLRRLSASRDGFYVISGILSEMSFVLLLALGGLALCFLFNLF